MCPTNEFKESFFVVAHNPQTSLNNDLLRILLPSSNYRAQIFNKKGFENFKFINGLQKKGLKETVKIYLQDGRTISCTPEHKFMLYDGTWCEAKDLKNKE